MIGINPDCPPGVALLADHLDAALAAGEDLVATSLPARADLDEVDPQSAPEALDAFVQRLLQLEASLVLRLLQARRLAIEVGRGDPAMKSVASLFRVQTDALHDLIATRDADGVLARAGDCHAYIRSRGLIAPEAAAPSPFETLAVDDSFRVGGVIRLSQILDFVATTLDLLDARFGLYMPDLPDTPVAAGEGVVTAPPAEAGREAFDSLARVLGLVRAAARARPDEVVTNAAVATPASAVQPPAMKSPTSGSVATGSTEIAGRTEAAAKSESDKNDDKRDALRTVNYRSLSSLIAEVQRTPDRF
ncbi:MAG: hypothetical protein AB7O71_18140 [Hyphomicrobiaceae bacterium]